MHASATSRAGRASHRPVGPDNGRAVEGVKGHAVSAAALQRVVLGLLLAAGQLHRAARRQGVKHAPAHGKQWARVPVWHGESGDPVGGCRKGTASCCRLLAPHALLTGPLRHRRPAACRPGRCWCRSRSQRPTAACPACEVGERRGLSSAGAAWGGGRSGPQHNSPPPRRRLWRWPSAPWPAMGEPHHRLQGPPSPLGAAQAPGHLPLTSPGSRSPTAASRRTAMLLDANVI